MNQLQMLEKIAIIEKAILELKESISANANPQPIFTPVQWDKNLKGKTKDLIICLVNKYGYDNPIKRDCKFVKDEIWKSRTTDFARILHTLRDRGFCKLVVNTEGSYRIESFTFIKP